MAAPELVRATSHGVTLLGDPSRPGGVTLAFTERSGGVSSGAFSSLNLGDRCGDDPALVALNRRRALAAVGAAELEGRLVLPNQVHGDHVVVVTDGSAASVLRAQEEASEGADAVVCTAREVPVLMVFADCVPVVLVCRDAFAVVHSGWRGAMARIAEKAVRALCDAAGTNPAEVLSYIGPHVGPCDYVVSADLASRFEGEFGPGFVLGGPRLDLGAVVRASLLRAGVLPGHVAECDASTASHTNRFFSYRAEGGVCGRHGALAVLLADQTHGASCEASLGKTEEREDDR